MQQRGRVRRVTGVTWTDAEVYAKHKDELMRFAAALVGPDDAGDVLSTVVTRILASGRTLSSLRDPRPYLMRAVLNQSRSHHRARQRRPRPVADGTEPAPEARPEVLEAVLNLPVRQRAVTYLVYWVGMTAGEVAELLGTRPATVRRYLHLAREKLRGVLDA